MPDYVVTHYYRDVFNGESTKQYSGTFTDFATARTAADALLTDAQALTDGHLYRETLAESNDIAGSSAATSNVFERISATVSLSGGEKGNLLVPSPIAGVFTGNALDLTATEWTDFTANFSVGNWTISDGEAITSTVRGRRIFARSGRTNLPV